MDNVAQIKAILDQCNDMEVLLVKRHMEIRGVGFMVKTYIKKYEKLVIEIRPAEGWWYPVILGIPYENGVSFNSDNLRQSTFF